MFSRIGEATVEAADLFTQLLSETDRQHQEEIYPKIKAIETECDNIVISIKSSDIIMSAKAHELISQKTDHPLHVGITEAGTLYSGNIKSAIGLGLILNEGIGDTIRVSLTGDPLEEIKSAKLILKTLGVRSGGIDVVSCPTCGRTKIGLIELANEVEQMVAEVQKEKKLDIRVAVMGCVVSGPGGRRRRRRSISRPLP